mmetsp:Transcript_28930/g.96324  ORF Transcript_28930/g.96324 Transcript_28930/m.96324 type:complete len:316 (-) Transcript_28930:3035-3982(-)
MHRRHVDDRHRRLVDRVQLVLQGARHRGFVLGLGGGRAARSAASVDAPQLGEHLLRRRGGVEDPAGLPGGARGELGKAGGRGRRRRRHGRWAGAGPPLPLRGRGPRPAVGARALPQGRGRLRPGPRGACRKRGRRGEAGAADEQCRRHAQRRGDRVHPAERLGRPPHLAHSGDALLPAARVARGLPRLAAPGRPGGAGLEAGHLAAARRVRAGRGHRRRHGQARQARFAVGHFRGRAFGAGAPPHAAGGGRLEVCGARAGGGRDERLLGLDVRGADGAAEGADAAAVGNRARLVELLLRHVQVGRCDRRRDLEPA